MIYLRLTAIVIACVARMKNITQKVFFINLVFAGYGKIPHLQKFKANGNDLLVNSEEGLGSFSLGLNFDMSMYGRGMNGIRF